MLFTITRDQYERYKDSANFCRQYILDKFSDLCNIVDTFNRYFGADNVDIYGDGFVEKSLLLTLLEDYEESCTLVQRTLEEYLDTEISVNYRTGLFENLAIYVHWPEVEVTNERHQSITITDLYAKIPIHPSGTMTDRFTLTRSTYPHDQFYSGYMHSHTMGINPDPAVFMHPCLGSGPLVRTIDTLMSSSDVDLWNLFCVELDRYVHVESIAGVPYRYLDQVSVGRLYEVDYYVPVTPLIVTINSNDELKKLLKKFFKYILIRKKMKFGISEGRYVSAYSDAEWVLNLSRAFLKFYSLLRTYGRTSITQRFLFQQEILKTVKIRNNTLYEIGSSGRLSNNSFEGRHVLYFKGEDILSHVGNTQVADEVCYYIINPAIALTFRDQCINYLNIYEHEKEKNVIRDSQQESEIISGDSPDCSSGSTIRNTFAEYPFGERRVAISL